MLNSSIEIDEAVDLIQRMRDICKAGGFNLTKFVSSKIEMMKSIPEEFCKKKSSSKNLKVEMYKKREQ